MKVQMKPNTGKKILSVVLTLFMLLSLMTAIPVSAAGPVFTATLADGTPFTDGMTGVPVAGTITFNFDGALADSYTGFLTLQEVQGGSDTVISDARVVPQTKGADGKSFTLNFTEGFLRPMGTYVLTLKTGFTAGGAALASDVSYTFTTGGNGYYIYDEFERYQTYEDRNGTSSKRPWGGGATYSGQGVTTKDGEKALYLNVAAGRSAHSAYYPKYIPSDLPLYTSASGGQANALTTETEFDFKLAEGDTGTVVKFNNGSFTIKLDEADSDGLALYIGSERMCEVALNTRYTLRFIADYWSASSTHTSSTEKRIRELTLSTETTPGSNLITTPIALSTSSQVKTAFTYDNTNTGYANVFSVSAAATAAAKFYVYNYKHRPVVGVESISVVGDPLVKVDETITVKFGDIPKAATGNTVTNELMGLVPGVDGIILEKIGGGIVTWSSDGYDAINNEIVLEPTAMLDHNAQYKVTVPVRNYTLIGSGDAKVYTFTTGWEK
ncbi:MAG: Ig-like domain-containing protein, partial [Clostridia bacterium]|nr:Ig-like domain-containing protein [Clostridia bacterium]